MGKVDGSQRQALIHLLRSEKTPAEAAEELGRSVSWSYKWQERYRQAGWDGLKERSRIPHHIALKTSEPVRQSHLANAQRIGGGSFVGRQVVLYWCRCHSWASAQPRNDFSAGHQARLSGFYVQSGVTKPRQPKPEKDIEYPTLHVSAAHRLTQVDIVPHYLKGGKKYRLLQRYRRGFSLSGWKAI